jgi:hypothetical protein
MRKSAEVILAHDLKKNGASQINQVRMHMDVTQNNGDKFKRRKT